MPKKVESSDQLSKAAKRCRSAGRRMGRHDWPDAEEIKRSDMIVTRMVKGRAVEAKLTTECKRGCGVVQESSFRIKWSPKGAITAVIPMDEAPVTKYPDFYLRAKGEQYALDLDAIRGERWQAAMGWLTEAEAGVK